MDLYDIERNNLKQAEAFYRERGEISGETYRILWRLQDDPEEFEKLSADWNITS